VNENAIFAAALMMNYERAEPTALAEQIHGCWCVFIG
jgi:hypothetical protein